MNHISEVVVAQTMTVVLFLQLMTSMTATSYLENAAHFYQNTDDRHTDIYFYDINEKSLRTYLS